MTEIKIETDFEQLRINEASIDCPWDIEEVTILDGSIIVALGSFRSAKSPRHQQADFTLPDEHRNIVAFDRHGEIVWFVGEPPEDRDLTGHYYKLYGYQDHLTARFEGEYLDHINPNTGQIIESLPLNQLPIGERIVTLDGEVSSLVELDDRLFVGCRSGDNGIYAFEADGTELWRSDAGERRGYLYEDDGELWEVLAVGRDKDDHHRIDPETGERIDGWSNYDE